MRTVSIGRGWLRNLAALLCLIAWLAKAQLTQTPAPWAAPVTNWATLAWDADAVAVKGYVIFYGIAPRDYSWIAPAGPDLQLTISNLACGLTYYFAVEAFEIIGTNKNKSLIRIFSPPSDEVTWSVPQADGLPQLLITNGVYLVNAFSSSNAVLESSSNLVNWQSVATLTPGVPLLTTGPAAGNQFFRIKPTP